MKTSKTSPAQIRSRGLEALAKALGPVGMVRFLQEFDVGSGDYTEDRHRWLEGVTVRKAIEGIKKWRRQTSR